ncbi:unnamed protein product, partial [Symbiodinium pilosum]
DKYLKADRYTKQGDNPSILTEVPARLTVIGRNDPNFGEWKTNSQKSKNAGEETEQVLQWKENRNWFFNALKGLMERFAARQNNKEFDRHLRYFTSAIGPVVEEAFFINEALNDMKGYLGIWAKESQM